MRNTYRWEDILQGMWQGMWQGRYNRFVSMILGAFLISLHFIIFNSLFPNSKNGLGHDYALFLPALLDGAYWQSVNGIWETPWFTPSFCGGVPKFANPNAGFYSIPQFLSFIFSPLISIKITFILFSGLGYWGFYLLLRRVFYCHRYSAILGAALFLFNSFFAYRLAIGHLTYHGFMLIPWIAYFNLHEVCSTKAYYILRRVMYLCAASIMVAYLVLSGMINLILPAMIAVGLIVLFKFLQLSNRTNKRIASDGLVAREYYLEKLAIISFVALALSASQIVATLSFLKHFPRDFYPLPGVPSIFDILHLIFKILFIEPDNVLAEKIRVNARWTADQHEHELGISMIPLFIGLLFMFTSFSKRWLLRFQNPKSIFLLIVIACSLSLPIVVNFYTPSWNAILKETPIIGSSSTLVRWYCLYIPIVILVTSLIYNRLIASQRKILCSTGFFLIVLVVGNALTNRDYYHKENYPSNSIDVAYKKLESSDFSPFIDRVSNGDDLTKNASNINCYEPIFGYLKETFPMKTLHDGPALISKAGVLNVKNPACYLFPEENNCEPGDHFTVKDTEQAERFLSYKPFAFTKSKEQLVSGFVSKFFWLVSVSVLFFGLIFLLFNKVLLRFR